MANRRRPSTAAAVAFTRILTGIVGASVVRDMKANSISRRSPDPIFAIFEALDGVGLSSGTPTVDMTSLISTGVNPRMAEIASQRFVFSITGLRSLHGAITSSGTTKGTAVGSAGFTAVGTGKDVLIKVSSRAVGRTWEAPVARPTPTCERITPDFFAISTDSGAAVALRGEAVSAFGQTSTAAPRPRMAVERQRSTFDGRPLRRPRITKHDTFVAANGEMADENGP